MSCKAINTRLGKIEYRAIGSGISIVFVHGGHSNCHETLSHKGFDLGKHQLITPSRPGYGKTPLHGNLTARKSADLIVELLNHLSVDNAVVYGISAGGPTAIELAACYPNRVNKLILASSVSEKWLDKNEKTRKIAQIVFNPKIEKFVWGMVRLRTALFTESGFWKE